MTRKYSRRIRLPGLGLEMLEPYQSNTIPSRVEPPLPPVDIDENIYDVQAIRDSKKVCSKVHYLIHWKGYGPNNDTWEPRENLLGGGEDVVREFHKSHPNAPHHSAFI